MTSTATPNRRRSLPTLLREIAACRICADALPHGPRPVLQAAAEARVLIAGQAPGRRVHESGVPWNDPSGDRLRSWLGVSREQFYDPAIFALVPMGFCWPGSSKGADLPPRPECAAAWRDEVLTLLPKVELTLVIGAYAQAWHLETTGSVTAQVQDWRSHWPDTVPLPHPSPRNIAWFARNPWFEVELLPALRRRLRTVLR